MIFQLLKRDPAWKATPFAVATGLALSLTLYRTQPDVVVGVASSLPVFWAVFASLARQFNNRFLAPLPIRVRDVYTARVIAVLLLIWLSLGTAASSIHGILPIAWAAFASLTALILESIAITRPASPIWLVVLFTPLFSVAPIFLRSRPEWLREDRVMIFAAVCGTAAALLFFSIWRTAASSFQIAPTKTGGRLRELPGTRTPARGLRAWLIVYPWQYSLWVGVIFLQAVGSGALGSTWIAFAFVSLLPAAPWLCALPVSRRGLLPFLLLPGILSATAGVVARSYLPFLAQTSARVVHEGDGGCTKPNVAVPLELWRLKSGGQTEAVYAPWGEKAEPPPANVSGKAVFNPYWVGCKNSSQFFDWQYARAKAAICAPLLQARMLAQNLVLVLTFSLLAITTALSCAWRTGRRRSRVVRFAPVVLAFVIWLTAIVWPSAQPISAAEPAWQIWSAHDALVRLSWILPKAWLLAAMVPAVWLYVVADKLFREGEFLDKKAAPVA